MLHIFDTPFINSASADKLNICIQNRVYMRVYSILYVDRKSSRWCTTMSSLGYEIVVQQNLCFKNIYNIFKKSDKKYDYIYLS